MKKKKKPAGVIKTLGVCALGFFSIAFIGMIFAFLPDPHNPSPGMLMAVLALASMTSFFSFFSYARKAFGGALGGAICCSGLFLLIAIHGIGSVIPGWVWSLPLIAAFGLAWLLPTINSRLAHRINDEQFAPKTRLGKGCLVLFMSLAGTSGACGSLFGIFSSRLAGGANLGMMTIGILFSILALGFAQTFAYQMWERRQMEQRAIREHGDGIE